MVFDIEKFKKGEQYIIFFGTKEYIHACKILEIIYGLDMEYSDRCYLTWNKANFDKRPNARIIRYVSDNEYEWCFLGTRETDRLISEGKLIPSLALLKEC